LKALTKIFKNKKGMTLMELVVGMVMFTIISITISMLLAPILSAYTRANDFAEYNALLDNIANEIINDISQSTAPPVFTAGSGDDGFAQDNDGIFLRITTPSGIIRYAVIGGVLQREGLWQARDEYGLPVGAPIPRFDDVFAEDFYKRKTVSFNWEADTDPNVYTLTVRLTENRGWGAASFEIQRDYAVRPLMLNQFD
jgi:type II secretory pathway component PulJ